MKYLLGVDLGTSSLKCLAVDAEGNQVAFAQVPLEINMPHDGYAEQAPELWWEATKLAIGKMTQENPRIARDIYAIGLSGQMHGLVPLDRNCNVVRPCIIWADQRSDAQINSISDRVGEDELYSILGNRVATGTLLPSLLWIRKNEAANFAEIDKIFLPKDYVRYRLTGGIGAEISDASGTSIFDIAQRQWAQPLIEALGISPEIFPSLHASFDLAGQIEPRAAAETGLRAGTPVYYGGGDHPTQAFGNGVVHPGTILSNIGTGSQVSTPISSPIFDPEHRICTYCHVLPNMWYLMGGSHNGGITLKWLKDKVFPHHDYDELTRGVGGVPPGSDGLIFLPYLLGERTPYFDPNARGMFFGLRLKHNQNHFIRSVMEGTLFALKDSLLAFASMGIDTAEIIASGGGARSELWLQMQADILERKVSRSSCSEQACLGAGMIAATGAGLFRSYLDTRDNMVTYEKRVFEPDDRNAAMFEKSYAIYRELYAQNKELFQKLEQNHS